MNGNYQWQKHQAEERHQARLQEAEGHRLAIHDVPSHEPFVALARRLLRSLIGHQRGKELARAEPKFGVDR